MGLSQRFESFTHIVHIIIQKRRDEAIFQIDVTVAISDERNYQIKPKKGSQNYLSPLCQGPPQRLSQPKFKILKMKLKIQFLDSVTFC